jgi:hypothetical protein
MDDLSVAGRATLAAPTEYSQTDVNLGALNGWIARFVG